MQHDQNDQSDRRNYLTTEIPNDMKVEIFSQCPYSSQICLYNFFSKYDEFLEISSFQRNFETRCLNQSELKYLIKNDHGKVLNYLKTTTPHHWYLKSYIPISANILELASKYGNIYLIEEILRTYQYSDTDYILYSKCTSNALQKGHLECFRLLRQFNFPIEPYIFIAAAKGTSGTAIFKELTESELNTREEIFDQLP